MAHEQYNKKISKIFFFLIYKLNKRLKLITYASLHKTWSQLIVQYVGIKTHPKKKKKILRYYQFTTQYLQIDMINIIINDTNYVIKKITFLICLKVNTSIYNIKQVKFITSLALLIYPFL